MTRIGQPKRSGGSLLKLKSVSAFFWRSLRQRIPVLSQLYQTFARILASVIRVKRGLLVRFRKTLSVTFWSQEQVYGFHCGPSQTILNKAFSGARYQKLGKHSGNPGSSWLWNFVHFCTWIWWWWWCACFWPSNLELPGLDLQRLRCQLIPLSVGLLRTGTLQYLVGTLSLSLKVTGKKSVMVRFIVTIQASTNMLIIRKFG